MMLSYSTLLTTPNRYVELNIKFLEKGPFGMDIINVLDLKYLKKKIILISIINNIF